MAGRREDVLNEGCGNDDAGAEVAGEEVDVDCAVSIDATLPARP